MYYVYILKCKDHTFYTGITTNLERRVLEHNNSNKGAKYTKNRRPVSIVYFKTCGSRSEALREERKIKELNRNQKINLIKNNIIS